MKIVMSKEEFEEFAKDALRVKYDKMIPEGMKARVDVRYSEVTINFFKEGEDEE